MESMDLSTNLVIDSAPVKNVVRQLSTEIHDALQISKEDLEEVERFEFSLRLVPELSVKVFPRH